MTPTSSGPGDPAPVPLPGTPPTPGPSSAPALNPPAWSGRKTAIAAALAIGVSSIAAAGAAVAIPTGSDQAGQFQRGGFGPGGPFPGGAQQGRQQVPATQPRLPAGRQPQQVPNGPDASTR